MEANRKQLDKVKKAWLKYTGKEISDDKARELLDYLVKLMLPIYY